MGRRRGKKGGNRISSEIIVATIHDLSHDGRGVTEVEGKKVFVIGALPGERIRFNYLEVNRSYDVGRCIEILEPSEDRVDALCEVFSICGGCSLQHLQADRQIEAKERILLENFRRIGKVEAEEVVPPMRSDSSWGYRQKARLGVRDVPAKGRVLVGFREHSSSFLTNMLRCEVLHPSVGEKLEVIGDFIASLDARKRIAQIEVAVDDLQTVLVFRNLDPLSEGDLDKLRLFAQQESYAIYLQPKGPDSVQQLWPEEIDLHYRLDSFDVNLHFEPTDFTQVNASINRQMIARALEWLDVEDKRVLDLFCGIGNFTLPLARRAREVVGIEGSETLVTRARKNAEINGLDNLSFHTADLSKDLESMAWWKEPFDRVLLDPARDGAAEALPFIASLKVPRILYVSCNPATLARDAGILVEQYGYRMLKAGVMDMFPHTAHVESIALFVKER